MKSVIAEVFNKENNSTTHCPVFTHSILIENPFFSLKASV